MQRHQPLLIKPPLVKPPLIKPPIPPETFSMKKKSNEKRNNLAMCRRWAFRLAVGKSFEQYEPNDNKNKRIPVIKLIGWDVFIIRPFKILQINWSYSSAGNSCFYRFISVSTLREITRKGHSTQCSNPYWPRVLILYTFSAAVFFPPILFNYISKIPLTVFPFGFLYLHISQKYSL